MTENPQDKDWLDEMLAEEPEYIHDDGFTSRVIASLPQKSTHNVRTLATRRIILGLSVLFAVVAGLISLPPEQEIGRWARIATNSAIASPMLAIAIIFAAGLTVISASLFWVVREE